MWRDIFQNQNRGSLLRHNAQQMLLILSVHFDIKNNAGSLDAGQSVYFVRIQYLQKKLKAEENFSYWPIDDGMNICCKKHINIDIHQFFSKIVT